MEKIEKLFFSILKLFYQRILNILGRKNAKNTQENKN